MKNCLECLIYFFSSDVTPKEPTISPITKFYKRSQIVSSVMPSLCKLLLTRNNVKNDVRKDSPIRKGVCVGGGGGV